MSHSFCWGRHSQVPLVLKGNVGAQSSRMELRTGSIHYRFEPDVFSRGIAHCVR